MIDHIQWTLLFVGVAFGLMGLTVGFLVGVNHEKQEHEDSMPCTCNQIGLALDDMHETRTPQQYLRSLETLQELSPRSVRCRRHGTVLFESVSKRAAQIGQLAVVKESEIA